MRRLFPFVLAVAIAIAGCGKSGDQKRAESDLQDEIMKLHDYSMASLGKIKVLNRSLDSALDRTGSPADIRHAVAGDSSAASLRTAKEALDRSTDAMELWMSEYRPYDERGDHDAVMAQLKAEKESLARATAGALSAIDTASAALEQYRRLVQAPESARPHAHAVPASRGGA